MGASYRADVDGLRAIAVVPVLLFHASVPGFSGGFVGVDVFFVISGFLITGLIAEESRQGRFSLASFYERRIRRIFPALFVVILACGLAAAPLLLPTEFAAFGRSAAATALFSSNILFWREAGYFDAGAHTKPLLHTWSLAVEEQFYIVFPLVMLLVGPRRWKLLVALGLLGSFIGSAIATSRFPTANFYLAPTRAWELMLGAALALRLVPPPARALQTQAAGLAGFGLIAWAVFRFTGETSFPGPNALFPCLGAALIIYAGQGPSIVNRALSTWPFVFIGLISYSLYLWHWPVLVFAEHVLSDPPDLGLRLALLGLSGVLAALSWRYVEKPFRERRVRVSRPILFCGAGAAIACVVVLGGLAYALQGMPGRLPPEAVRYAGYGQSRYPRGQECVASFRWRAPLKQACTEGADVAPTIAVWGDSHAATMARALGEIARKHGQAVRLHLFAGCPPVVGVARRDQGEDPCIAASDQTMRQLLGPDIRTVLIYARYAVYADGHTPYELKVLKEPQLQITDVNGRLMTRREQRTLFGDQMRATIAALENAGKRVILVYPTPEMSRNVPETAAKMALARQDLTRLDMRTSVFMERNAFVLGALDAAGSPSTVRVYPQRLLCDETRCPVMRDGKLLYADDDHLSLEAADYVAPLLEKALFPSDQPVLRKVTDAVAEPTGRKPWLQTTRP